MLCMLAKNSINNIILIQMISFDQASIKVAMEVGEVVLKELSKDEICIIPLYTTKRPSATKANAVLMLTSEANSSKCEVQSQMGFDK